MDKKFIEKYFKNNCSEEELVQIFDWFNNYAHTNEGKSILYETWEKLPETEPEIRVDFKSILHRIHYEINLHQSKILIDNSGNDLVRYNSRKHILTIIRNVAAILLLPVLGLGLFYSVRYYSAHSIQKMASLAYNEISSSVDAITKVTLPDGSVAWLNHSSSLCYPAIFAGNTRHVELKGEGYFEVAHNENIPFVVAAGDIHVVAHGTKFNVMAYPGENKIEISLISGSVELQTSLPTGKTETLYKMNPGDHSSYDRTKEQLITGSVNDDRYFSWKDGKLIFTAEPMAEVIKKLSRWFNIDIYIKDPELNDFPLTATFEQESLPQVLELLTLVSPVNYYISDREATSNGGFSKRKVYLSHRR